MPQIIAPIAAFAATPLGGLVTSVGLNIGAQLLGQAFGGQQRQSTRAPGVVLQVQAGGDVPVQFPLGWTATAGMRSYMGTWGSAGGTPNAFAVEERVLSWLPCPDRPVPWIGEQRCTVDWDATPTTQGYPVLEFRQGGVDYAWVRYEDGTQTTASAYMTSVFGSHPDRPYDSGMVGHGCAKVQVTLRRNREIWSSFPELLFETTGIALYDISQDSSEGGDGDQRWDDPATWTPSSNLAVQMYNLRRGLFYYPADFDAATNDNRQWVYGGSNKRPLTSYRLPAASWIAAIAASANEVDIGDDETEPAYRAGLVVTGDAQPREVLDGLRRAGSARMAEVGGRYELLVGAPGAAVYSFTDADIVITDPQTFDPFRGIEQTYNAVEGNYTEPAERWTSKPAPGRYNTEWEAEDGGRTLPMALPLLVVPYANQVQRVHQAAANDNRNFREFTLSLPPDAYDVVKPNQVVSWTSAGNGFTAKSFQVLTMRARRGWNQVVRLREIDDAGFDFDPDTQTLPISIGTVARQAVPSQPSTGGNVSPYEGRDADGNARRPGIDLAIPLGQEDVRAIGVQIRLAGAASPFFEQEYPYGTASSGTQHIYIVGDPLLSDTGYEVSWKIVPYSGRKTDWSSWLAVPTPLVKLGSLDVDFGSIAADLQASLDWLYAGVRQAISNFERLGTTLAESDLANFNERQALSRELRVTAKNLEAGFNEIIEVALGPSGAIGGVFQTLYSAMGGSTSQVNVAWGTLAADTGFEAKYGVGAFVDDDELRTAAFGINVPSTGQTSFWVEAQRFTVSYDGDLYALFSPGGAYLDNARITNLTADNIAAGSLTADVIDVAGLVADEAFIENLSVGTINIEDGAVTSLYYDALQSTTGFSGTGSTATWLDIDVDVDLYGPAVSAFVDVTVPATSDRVYTLTLVAVVGGADVTLATSSSPSVAGGTRVRLFCNYTGLLGTPGTYTYKLKFGSALSAPSNYTIHYVVLSASVPQK